MSISIHVNKSIYINTYILTNMLTVDTTTELGQVDVSFCIHILFIYEASWEWSKGASFADRYADS